MDLLLALATIQEKAEKIEDVADGSKQVADVRSELGLRNKPMNSPLMTEEHAKMVANGRVKPKDMDEAYRTIRDMGDYVVTGNNPSAKE